MEVFRLDSWLHAEPNFSNPAMFVSAFKCTIQPGHFIHVCHNGSKQIGSFHSHQNVMEQQISNIKGCVKVNWYSELSSLGLVTPVLADSSSYGHLSSNVELAQTMNSSWIDAILLIQELCFIFFMLMSFML
jgi:S-adenosylmethionine synthetase